MTTFTIEKSQVKRLKALQKYAKLINPILPVSDFQVFVIEDKKLNVYTIGEKAISYGYFQSEVCIDILFTQIDTALPNNFGVNLKTLLQAIDGSKSDDIDFTLTEHELKLSSQTSNFKWSVKLIENKDDQEIKEIQGLIGTRLALPTFQNAIKVDFGIGRFDITNIIYFMKVYPKSENIFMKISLDCIKCASNFCILKKNIYNSIAKSEVFLHRDYIKLFDNVDSALLSSDNTFWYIEDDGIKIFLAQQGTKWAYPSDSDLEDYSPTPNKTIKVEINAGMLYNKLKEFYKVFKGKTFEYGDIKIEVPDDFHDIEELKLSWDDGYNKVETTLPVDIISYTDNTVGFDYFISTKEFMALENYFHKDDNSVINYEFNSIESGQQHGTGTIFWNDDLTVNVPKRSI